MLFRSLYSATTSSMSNASLTRCKPCAGGLPSRSACAIVSSDLDRSAAETRLADQTGIPVLCYGLRTDFQGELFPGAKLLLGIADSLVELKAVCHCGRKSSMNLRVDGSGAAVKQGAQTEIGGNDRYVALCRKHFAEALGWWE